MFKIYAAETSFFGPEETRILGNLAFALNHRARGKRLAVEVMLTE